MEERLSHISQQEKSETVTTLKQMQEDWLRNSLFPSRPEEQYVVREIDFVWEDVPYEHKCTRTDVLYKDVP